MMTFILKQVGCLFNAIMLDGKVQIVEQPRRQDFVTFIPLFHTNITSLTLLLTIDREDCFNFLICSTHEKIFVVKGYSDKKGILFPLNLPTRQLFTC